MLKLHKLFRYSKHFFVLVSQGGAVISMEIYHSILSAEI